MIYSVKMVDMEIYDIGDVKDTIFVSSYPQQSGKKFNRFCRKLKSIKLFSKCFTNRCFS